jgi:ubiquinone/menaquinone biosynthesis C-methylase UbiE
MKAMPRNLQNMSRVYSNATWDVYEFLQRSLSPRSSDSLLELAGHYLSPGSVILDAGCRDAQHLIRLVEQYDATGVGVDPVAIHIERGKAAVAEAGLKARITLSQGVMHELPYPDAHFDFVWCRDVVEQVDDLRGALDEVRRVLKPQGPMLIYTVFATDRLEPREKQMLDQHLGNVPSNLGEDNVEAVFSDAGFSIERKDVVGTEWREHAEEQTKPASRALLQLSRLRRQREEVIQRFGKDIYDHVEANLHWEVYQLLGKLEPTVYVLRNSMP